MAIYTKDGDLVIVNGALAAGENCCCPPETPCCVDCTALPLAISNGLLLTVSGAEDFTVVSSRTCTNGYYNPPYDYDVTSNYLCGSLNGSYELINASLLAPANKCNPYGLYNGPNIWMLRLGEPYICGGGGILVGTRSYSIPDHKCLGPNGWNEAFTYSSSTYATCVSCSLECVLVRDYVTGLCLDYIQWSVAVGGPKGGCAYINGEPEPPSSSAGDHIGCSFGGTFSSPLMPFCVGGSLTGTAQQYSDLSDVTVTFTLSVMP